MSATVETIREAVSRTREARERVQPHRTTDAVIAMLAQTAKNWPSRQSLAQAGGPIRAEVRRFFRGDGQ